MSQYYFVLLLWLLTKHVVADFFLQSELQLKDKGNFRSIGGYLHALIHGGLTGAIFLFMSNSLSTAFLAGAADAITHYIIDWSKANVTLRFNLTSRNKLYWYVFGLDQWLHTATIIALAFYFG
jgi:hypothetical protein